MSLGATLCQVCGGYGYLASPSPTISTKNISDAMDVTKGFLEEFRGEITTLQKLMFEAVSKRFRQGELEVRTAWKGELSQRYNQLWLKIESRLKFLRDRGIVAPNPNQCRTLDDWENAYHTHRCNGKTLGYWLPEHYRPLTDPIDLALTSASMGLASTDELQAVLRQQFEQACEFPVDRLHPLIRTRCEEDFSAGRFDHIILDAMKVIEDEVRTRSGAPPTSVGIQLMTDAMKGNDPTFTFSSVEPEQDGAYFLYRGAMGFFKNPHSHRFISTTEAEHVFEILMFASLLLRLLDSAKYSPKS